MMTGMNDLDGRYKRILKQLQDLLENAPDMTAGMATVAAVLHHKMPHFFWTGFYILRDGDMVVGPYQGPVACQILERHKGVCWASLKEKKTLVVPNVHEFPGHIACDSRSNSEIAVPLINDKNEAWAVFDIDSRELDAFSSTDQKWLEAIVRLL